MTTTLYKIHPAIGVCRVGNSNQFFIGPELTNTLGVEIKSDFSEIPIESFKQDGKIKRQGARFRVFEYEVDELGIEHLVGEVPGSQINWSVNVVNSKAAGNKLESSTDSSRSILAPIGSPRNPAILDRESLVIRPGAKEISGVNKGPTRLDGGRFLGEEVSLGDLHTDYAGRLIVLGGKGHSQGIPESPGGEIPPLGSFKDNNRWHDDVSDGTVKARVILDDGREVEAVSAWVVCAPPDFAPGVDAPVTIFDCVMRISIERGWKTVPQTPSFQKDVLPILKHSASMKWTHEFEHWNEIVEDWELLGKREYEEERKNAYDAIINASLHRWALPPHMKIILEKWRDGIFLEDYDPDFSVQLMPDILDRAALEACSGTSFFPGIEFGSKILNPTIYSDHGRISPAKIQPGELSGQMALPWQADFNDCDTDWWPSQRPVNVYTDIASIPNDETKWGRGVYKGNNSISRLSMVNDFWRLGYIVKEEEAQIEKDRDPTLT